MNFHSWESLRVKSSFDCWDENEIEKQKFGYKHDPSATIELVLLAKLCKPSYKLIWIVLFNMKITCTMQAYNLYFLLTNFVILLLRS